MDILKRALKVSLEIKADSAGCYFRHIKPDLKLGNLHYQLNKAFDPFPGRLSRDGGSGYRTYVFEESTRRCAIDRKG